MAGDRLAPFSAIVTAVRWAAVTMGLVLAATSGAARTDVLLGVGLLSYALWRTVVPLRYEEHARGDIAWLGAEALAVAGVVAASGDWSSDYVFALLTPIIAAGFARGYVFAMNFAVAEAAVVALARHLPGGGIPFRPTIEWTTELVLIAVVAGYGRRLSAEAARREEQTLGRMSRLSEANDLLFQLHRLAQTLPASLDLSDTVASTVARLRELFEPNVFAVLLHDDATGDWSVAASAGVRLPSLLEGNDLPPPVRRALRARLAILAPELTGSDGPGLSDLSRVGMYAPLWAREGLVGVIAVERRDPTMYTQRDLGLLDGLAEQAAMAIDNARWFGRLRRVGADEERTRIARDLHDRVGQSLAYLAFALDRITAKAERENVHTDLQELRDEMRSVVTEVRETLYDLRTDVSEAQGLAVTLGSFLDRVRARTDIDVEFSATADARLPLPVEREMWRIAQEAVTNVERHARARRVTVSWTCDPERAELVVTDDGQGLASTNSGRVDSYGLVGIRERADAIGASLDIASAPGRGTTVRCWLDREET